MFDKENLIEYYDWGYQHDPKNKPEFEVGTDQELINAFNIGAIHGYVDPDDDTDEAEPLDGDDLMFVLIKNDGWLLKAIALNYSDEEILSATGLEEAVMGIDEKAMRLIYSADKCKLILAREMKYSQAIEYFEYNTEGAYVGEKTPIWCYEKFYL